MNQLWILLVTLVKNVSIIFRCLWVLVSHTRVQVP